MTTLRQIINDAFRESGLTQTGVSPEADEFGEGLRKLQSLILSLYGNEMGSPLEDVSYGYPDTGNSYAKVSDVSPEIDSYFVPANVRLMLNLSAPKTVYLNPNPGDGARFAIIDIRGNLSTAPLTVDGNGRNIDDTAVLEVSDNGVNKQWFYRADLGQWTEVTALVADSESPFPTEFDDYLILLLALRLNPRYQASLDGQSVEALRRMKKQFSARYGQSTEVRVEDALYRLSSRGAYLYDELPTTNIRFNRGFIR